MENALFKIFSPPFFLTEFEKRRLLKLAPLFDIQVEALEESQLRVYGGPNKARTRYEDLPADLAYCRLVMELASKSARWIYFHSKEHCKDTLLNVSDARLTRIAELYRAWKDKGFPE